MQMIIPHPHHPSHLCQYPDSISWIFLEQFGLVARTSLSPFWILAILILSSFQSESTAARLISFSIVGSVWLWWGGVGLGVGRRRKAGGIIQQTNNRSAPTCFLIRLPTKFRENCEPRKSILAAILSFEKGLVDRGESMSTLGDKWVY